MFRHENTTPRPIGTRAGQLVVVLPAVLVTALSGTLHGQTPPVDLGTLGGTNSSASAVNASGRVVGTGGTAGDVTFHAFSWTAANGRVDLGTLGGGDDFSDARAVNASGQVVGESSSSDGIRAFSWTAAGGMIDL